MYNPKKTLKKTIYIYIYMMGEEGDHAGLSNEWVHEGAHRARQEAGSTWG